MLAVPSFGETPDFKKGTGLLRVRRIHMFLIQQAATNNVDMFVYIYRAFHNVLRDLKNL
jgi:hypothetical protein